MALGASAVSCTTRAPAQGLEVPPFGGPSRYAAWGWLIWFQRRAHSVGVRSPWAVWGRSALSSLRQAEPLHGADLSTLNAQPVERYRTGRHSPMCRQ